MDSWGSTTAIQFENVSFDSELYEEWIELRILFGDSIKVNLGSNDYRVVGLLMIDIKLKPGRGVVRGLELANQAAVMLASKKVMPQAPLAAPAVYLRVPELYKSNVDRVEGMKYQISCPFYYDVINLE